MNDENPTRQDTGYLGPSGTQRMSDEKRKLPDLNPALADIFDKAYLIREQSLQGEASRIELSPGRTVGGREDADIVVDDSTVSSHHFGIDVGEDGTFSIEDLGSSNGTVVNGREVQTSKLISGDRIQAGKSGFVFRTIQTIPWDQGS